jgi:hypothetical protein
MRRPPWRTLQGVGLGLVALAVLLIAARAIAPIALQRYVNRVLDRANGYHGQIGDVDISLWRGAYQIEDVDIVKDEARAAVLRRRVISGEWHALLDGALVGEIQLEQPELNFVAGPSPGDRQTGTETDWRKVVKHLLPIKINRVTARNGSMHFRSFRTKPPVDIYLRTSTWSRRTSPTARTSRTARAWWRTPTSRRRRWTRAARGAHRDRPVRGVPTARPGLRRSGVSLKEFNDLFRAYAGVDVERGQLPASD